MAAPAGGTYRTLALRTHGNYLVCAHGSLSPPQSEWSQMLEFFRGHPNLAAVRVLVHTDGAAPSASQRAELSALIGKVKVPVAVLTTSTLARTAGTALSWLNPAFRVFSPGDVDAALDHLGAGHGERRALKDLLDELKREVQSKSAVARSG